MIRQRTDEWYNARLGKFTASGLSALMAKPVTSSSVWSKSAINYIQNLALQLYLNEYTWRPDNDATRWGMRHEEKALHEFGSACRFQVKETGFVLHPRFPEVGATPDAIIVEDYNSQEIILAQVKCPYSQKNHLKYSGKIHDVRTLKKCRSAYFWQIQGEIWVTGASYSYFVSFDPRQTGKLRLHFAKIEPDQNAIDHFERIIPEAIEMRDKFAEQYRTGELVIPR